MAPPSVKDVKGGWLLEDLTGVAQDAARMDSDVMALLLSPAEEWKAVPLVWLLTPFQNRRNC
jgi:hypothetical protein